MSWDYKYHPKRPEDLLGEQGALARRLLNNVTSLPRKLVLEGDSSTGKTTIARMLALAILGYEDLEQAEIDGVYLEFDATINGRKDEVISTIPSFLNTRPFFGNAKVLLIEEAQALSKGTVRNPGAQDALLKVLDEYQIKDWQYIILTTDDYASLDDAFRSRLTRYSLKKHTLDNFRKTYKIVFGEEGGPVLEDSNIEEAYDAFGGNLREFLRFLEASHLSGRVEVPKKKEAEYRTLAVLLTRSSYAEILGWMEDEPPEFKAQVVKNFLLSCAMRGWKIEEARISLNYLKDWSIGSLSTEDLYKILMLNIHNTFQGASKE